MSTFDMTEMRVEYAQKLPEKLQALAHAVAEARANRPALVTATTLAHRLRGTAGTYGYASVGEAAGRLETALLDVEAAGGRASAWAAVDAALTETQAIARAAAAETLAGTSG